MLIAELSFLFWLALSFQWEFNCKGSLKIAGIREKLDFVCALDAMVSKTDIVDLFWHVSIKRGVGQSNLFSELVLSSGTPIKAFRYHSVWLKNVKTDQGYQFSYHGVQGTHKIQLLTYSSNVQRAFKVELSLESRRESEKEKRARQSIFNARHNTT